MSLLDPIHVSENHFNLIDGALVAEISDLGPGFRFDRIWHQAMDKGLTLERHSTREVVYYVSSEIRDGENELGGWKLTPIMAGHPEMIIFND